MTKCHSTTHNLAYVLGVTRLDRAGGILRTWDNPVMRVQLIVAGSCPSVSITTCQLHWCQLTRPIHGWGRRNSPGNLCARFCSNQIGVNGMLWLDNSIAAHRLVRQVFISSPSLWGNFFYFLMRPCTARAVQALLLSSPYADTLLLFPYAYISFYVHPSSI